MKIYQLQKKLNEEQIYNWLTEKLRYYPLI